MTGTPLSTAICRAASFELRARIAEAGRPDELDSRRLAGFRKRRLLGQESVAGMDRLSAAVVRDLDDALELQVGLTRRRASDVVGLVRVARVDRVAVGVRVDGGGGDAELAARAHHADGDLAAIRDQDLLEELAFSFSR